DVSNFNTSKVTDMGLMFYYCSSLTSLDISNFNTSAVTNMSSMFSSCSGLTSLDVSNFNTSAVTNMYYMFSSCSSLTSLDVSKFDTSSVTSMSSMFQSCSKLTNINLGNNFDRINGSYMFRYTSKLTSIISTRTTPMTVTNSSGTVVDNGLKTSNTTAVIYVPNAAVESAYEADSNYASLLNFTAETDSSRIEPILGLYGEDTVVVSAGGTYEEAATVAGFKSVTDTDITPTEVKDYGYTLTQTSNNVDLSTPGVYSVTYTLKQDGTTVDTVTRTVMVGDVTEPADQTVIEGTTVEFNADFTVPGINSKTYEWHQIKDGVDINLTEENGVIYKSNIEGQANTTATETIVINASEAGVLSFDYMVSSEANDKFTITIQDANGTITAVDSISGVIDWQNYSTSVTPTSDGKITLTLTYSKDSKFNGGIDCGAIKNLDYKIIDGVIATSTFANDSYFTIESKDTTNTSSTHAWVLEDGIYRSDSKEQNSSTATSRIEISMPGEGEVSFDYMVSSESSYDKLYITIEDANGTTNVTSTSGISGAVDWTTYTGTFTPNADGKVILKLKYTKDSSVNKNDDIGAIRNLKLDASVVVEKYTCTYTSDSNYQFTGNNWATATKCEGANTSKLTIPGEILSRLEFDGTKYYCVISGYKTREATLNVKEKTLPVLMEETQKNAITNKYLLGASRYTGEFELTSVTREKIKTITILDTSTDTIPSTYVAMWDASKDNDGSVTAWLVQDTEDTTMYHLYIGGECGVIASNGSYLFAYYTACTSIIGLNKLDTSNATSMSFMFFSCSSLTSLDVSGFNTSAVTAMVNMFDGCSGLTSLDVTKFNTINVTSMHSMFNRCSGLTSLDVTKFNTSAVTNMSYMFDYCSSLTNLDVSGFNTSAVTNMSYMFKSCSSLTSLDVSSLDTSSVINMEAIFSDCTNLTSINLNNLNTSAVEDMSHMFNECKSLTSLDLSGFDTSSATDMTMMFYSCRSLTSLDLSNFDTSAVTSMTSMFAVCYNLTNIYLGTNFDRINGASMFYGDSKLTAIISTRTTPMIVNDSNGTVVNDSLVSSAKNAVIYVPNATVESAYEADSNYASLLSFTAGSDSARIEPILGLYGDKDITVYVGDTYEEAATVAGFKSVTGTDITPAEVKDYGYVLTQTSNNVNLSTSGNYTVTYKLTLNGTQVDTITRNVKVMNPNYSVNGAYFETFRDAYDSITASEGIIKVEKDNTDSKYIEIAADKTITLNMNGKTITRVSVDDNEMGFYNHGTFIIDGGGTITTLDAKDNEILRLIQNTGTLTLKNVEIVNKGIPTTNEHYWEGVLTEGENSKLTIDGATIRTPSRGMLDDYSTYKYGARTVQISGGTLEVLSGNIINESDSYGYAIENDYMEKTTIRISGGTLTSNYRGVAIGNSRGTDLDVLISGGTVTAVEEAVVVNNGYTGTKAFEITGGTLTSTNNFAIKNATSSSVVIGDASKALSTTVPEIVGKEYAINATNGFNFNSGVLKGTSTKPYIGTPTLRDTNYYVKTTGPVSGVYSSFLEADTTGPNITVSDVEYPNVVKMTMVDTGAGLSYWGITNSQNAPTTTTTENTTAGSELDKWYLLTTTNNEREIAATNLNAGIYYAWAKDALGNMTSAKFEVTQAIPYLNPGKTSTSIYIGNSETISYSYNGDASALITASSSDDKKATVEIDTTNKTVTINAIAEGNVEITISAPAKGNYKEQSAIINVAVGTGNYRVNGKYYDTLGNAYNAITTDEGTIEVIGTNIYDYSWFEVAATKKVTIEMNGNTIIKARSSSVSLGMYNKGSLTIKGGGTITTMACANNKVSRIIQNEGTLVLEDVELINKGYNTDGADYWQVLLTEGANSSVTIDGATLKTVARGIAADSTTTNDGARVIAVKQGKLEILSGNFIEESETSGYVLEHSYSGATEIRISGGTFVSDDAGFTLGSNNGKDLDLIISGGTIEANDVAIAINSKYVGTKGVEITGGTVISHNTHAIYNGTTAAIIIGSETAELSTSEPAIIGKGYGVHSGNGFNFNNGVIKGENAKPYYGTPDLRDGKYFVKTTGPVSGVYSSFLELDEAGPEITVSNIEYPSNANITMQDTGSGLTHWAVTTSKTAPTTVNSANTTGSVVNQWYSLTATTSSKALVFTGLKVGTYYAYGKDVVGNVSYKEFKVTADPILMSESYENAKTNNYILGNADVATGALAITRDKVKSIKIIDTSKEAVPANAVATWDVSKEKNASVTAWLVQDTNETAKYNLYIGGNGGVIASSGYSLFAYYTSCTSITGLGSLDTSNVKSFAAMFMDSSALTIIDVTSLNSDLVEDMSNMFKGCTAVTEIKLTGLNTSKVTNFNSMFQDCTNLKTVNLSGFVTTSAQKMANMFYGCNTIETLDVSSFRTPNVTDMTYMFGRCSSVKELNVSNFDTTNVTSFKGMFQDCGTVTTLDVDEFKTGKATNFSCMFQSCTGLTSLDVSNFDTSAAKEMVFMFENCSALTSLDLSGFDTTGLDGSNSGYSFTINGQKVLAVNVDSLITGCSNLETILLGPKFDRIDGRYMFKGVSNLKAIISTATTPMQILNDNGELADNRLETITAVIYVPTEEVEALYEADSNYASKLNFTVNTDSTRVEPILALVGEKEITVKPNGTYEEAAKVAGYTSVAGADITPTALKEYGFVLAKESDVDLTTPGDYTVTYKLTLNGTQVATTTRNVNVQDVIPTVTTQPSNVAVNVGATAKFTVVASGTNLTYQWQQSTNGGTSWSNIANATDASYTTAATTSSMNGHQYRCVISNSSGSINSNAATLTVYYAPTIKTQPTNQTVTYPETATFTVAVNEGNPVTTYQWQYRTSNTGTWENIESATSASYTTTATTVEMTGWQYRCVIGNSRYADAVTSNAATLTVNKYKFAIEWDDTTTFEYNNSGQAPKITNVNANGKVTINGESITITRTTYIVPGKYTSVASTSNPNYELTNNTIDFEIVKGTFEDKEYYTDKELTYNGGLYYLSKFIYQSSVEFDPLKEMTQTFGLSADNITATGIPTFIDAGEYTVYYKFTLEHFNDYTNSFKVIIHPKPVSVTWGETSFVYNGKPQAPTATADSGISAETITIAVDGAQTNVGTNYIATARIGAVEGGQGKTSNYVITEKETTTFNITNAAGSVTASISGTTTVGQTLTALYETESDGAVTYQWWRGSEATPISGETKSTYKLVAADAGKYIGVTVSVAQGSNHAACSNTAKTTATIKDSAASITTHPSNATVTYPAKATFTVVASGSNITYQWQYRTSSSGSWANVTTSQGTGGTTTSFTTVATTVAMTGYQYRCVITNNAGSVNSNAATLTVNRATGSVTASISGTTTVGQTLTASGTTASDGTKTYQWWRASSASATSGTTLGTGSTYTLVAADSGYYIGVTVSVAQGSNYLACSDTAITTATIKDSAATVTTHPSNTTVTYPAKATFTVVASGSNITYQWQYRTSSSGSWANVTTSQGTGGTTTSFTTVATTVAMTGYQYRCVITNNAGSVNSNAATLTVNRATGSVTASISGTTTVGQTLTASGSTSSDGTKTYQWWRASSASATSGTNIGTGSTYILVAADAGSYIGVTVSVAQGSNYLACSDTAITTATIKDTVPTVTTHPSNIAVLVGATAKFTVVGSGTNLKYQWQQSTNGGTSWSNIANATSPSYTTAATTALMNGYKYRCVITNNAGSVTSNAATLTTGWDISENGDGSVMAYLTADPSNNDNYILTVSGTGKMKNFDAYNDVPWINYRSSVTEIQIGNGVTSVGDRAFYNFSQITEISFPSTITYIGTFSFYHCSKLTSNITIPKGTTSIGSNPFLEVPTTQILVESGNTAYNSSNGVLYTYDGKELITYPYGKTDTSYTVLSGTTTIGHYAFAGTKLTSINLPSTLTTIISYAFQDSNLTSVTIPSGVNKIYGQAFNRAASLQTVYLKSTTLNVLSDNSFTNLKSGSIIYTESKAIANKFIAGTNYTAANTKIYYPPTITKQPVDTKSIWDATATFSVEIAEGNPTSTYQWYKNGVAISGATKATYTTPILSADDNGDKYYCIVSNDDYYRDRGIVKSDVATLTVIDGRYSVIRGAEEIYYDSLQLAFDSLQSGETLNIKKDIPSEGNAELTGNKSIIFNTNDYTITMDDDATIQIDAGSKVVMNGTGTINKANTASKAIITNNGTLEVNGNVKMSNTNGYVIDTTGITTLKNGEYKGVKPIHASGTGKLVINGDNVKVIAEGNMTKDYGAITLEGSSTLDMSKGTISASSNTSEVKGILVKENSSANISGGKVAATSSNSVNQADAIALITNGDINISGNTSLTGSRSGITLLDSNTGDVYITGGTIVGGQVGIFNNSNASVKLGTETDESVGIIAPEIRGEEIAYVSFKAGSQLMLYDGVLQSAGSNVIYQSIIENSSNIITQEIINTIKNDADNTHKIHIGEGTSTPKYQAGYDLHLTTSTIEGKVYDVAYLKAYTVPIVNGPRNQTVKLNETATFEVTVVGGVPNKYTYEWQVSTDGGNTWQAVGSDSIYETPAATIEMDGYRYRCAVSNGVFTAYSNIVSLKIDKSSIQELPIDLVPVGKFTFPNGNVVSKIDGEDAIELELVIKSTSPLNDVVFNGTKLDLNSTNTVIVDNAKITKNNYIEIVNQTGEIAEYAYSFKVIVTENGIYTATFSDTKGHAGNVTQTISTFRDIPLKIECIVDEPTLYREYSVVTFIANRGVKFVSPEAFKNQINKVGNGEYSTKYTINVYAEINNIIFKFVDQSGYEKEVNVTVSLSSNNKIKLSSDSLSLGSISISEAFEKAQKLEKELEVSENKSVQSRYGVSSAQVDMFMSRARDVGAAVILSNASVTKSYDAVLPEKITSEGGSKLSTYGIQGVSNEYAAAFGASANGTSISEADAKYVDILKGSKLNLYKGFSISGFSIENTTQPYVLMTENSSAINVADTARNASFRVTIINK
ncbi:MAG: BspA family leucine-rich repeat surface protein, partial [Clostridia bacterium]|nr:BspA family leucine-rich repeat surface protein [Clostridia bacterium]